MASSQEPWLMLRLLLVLVFAVHKTTAFGEVMRAPQMEKQEGQRQRHKNAYATMMYMGTPRDYEFYVAIRVLLRSLARLHVDADLVVIASQDVPLRWVHTIPNGALLGDKGTRFFHATTVCRRQRNRIQRLRLENGVLMMILLKDQFSGIFNLFSVQWSLFLLITLLLITILVFLVLKLICLLLLSQSKKFMLLFRQ